MTESEDSRPTVEAPEKLTVETLESLDKSELIEKILAANACNEELTKLRESEEKTRQQLAEVTRREALLLKTLTEKEREIADLAMQIEELKQYQLPSNQQLRATLLEPTVNLVFSRMKQELETTKQKLEDSQSELSAWKFTSDSQTGKQLMARCRTLIKENDELGKQISQGRVAKLEGEIALEKRLVQEIKAAQNDSEQFLVQIDEDTEAMQATTYLLRELLQKAQAEITRLGGTFDDLPTDDPSQEDCGAEGNGGSNEGNADPNEGNEDTSDAEMEQDDSATPPRDLQPITSDSPSNGDVTMNGLTDEEHMDTMPSKSVEQVTNGQTVSPVAE